MPRAARLAVLALAVVATARPAAADVRAGCAVAAHPAAPYAECSFAADGPVRYASHGTAAWEIQVVRGEYVETYVVGDRDSVGTIEGVLAGDVVRVTMWAPTPGAGLLDVREAAL